VAALKALTGAKAGQGTKSHTGDATAEKTQARQAKAQAAQAAALEQSARRFVERLALALQGALMLEQTPRYVADTFIAARMGRNRGLAFGTLPAKTRVKAIVERAMIK
jgi:putative acyl-CoA dehydrogenase